MYAQVTAELFCVENDITPTDQCVEVVVGGIRDQLKGLGEDGVKLQQV